MDCIGKIRSTRGETREKIEAQLETTGMGEQKEVAILKQIAAMGNEITELYKHLPKAEDQADENVDGGSYMCID